MSEGNRLVLVTGGNKGIGHAICRTLLSQHDDIAVLLGSRDIERGRRAVEELKASIPHTKNRIDLIILDTSSDESVASAAAQVASTYSSSSSPRPLFGIVNNAGIVGSSYRDVLNVNYFGPRRVNDAFGKLLRRPGGRIINIASASGPVFVSSCSDSNLRSKLSDAQTPLPGGISEVDTIAKSYLNHHPSSSSSSIEDVYGLSKALLNSYTAVHAKAEPDFIIHSCTPGYIDTDMTRSLGYGGNPKSTMDGANCPVYLMTSEDVNSIPSGQYFGSDCVRSPLGQYRGPGDPPFEGP